jgi:nucleoside-diphosphate-sugar epimerase
MNTTVDPRTEPILHEPFVFDGADPEKRADGILLTGPSAFVGVFVLRELLQRWEGEIHCLIRADSRAHAVQRIERVARRWAVGPLDLCRVTFHTGDCTLPNWGMSEASFQEVKEKTGAVIHLALTARWDLPYSHYREQWLPELRRMIGFCGDPRFPKSLHYPNSFNSHFLKDDADFARIDSSAWHSGYTAFKWASEMIVRRALGGNLPGCLYDIPLVIGSADTGLCPPQYAARQIFRLCVETGVGIEFAFKIIAVDWLARIMVHNVCAEKTHASLRYVRPVLPDTMDLPALFRALAPARPFERGAREELLCRAKNRGVAEFLLPPDFQSIIGKGHCFPPVLPPSIMAAEMPAAFDVFRANTRVWLKNVEGTP